MKCCFITCHPSTALSVFPQMAGGSRTGSPCPLAHLPVPLSPLLSTQYPPTGDPQTHPHHLPNANSLATILHSFLPCLELWAPSPLDSPLSLGFPPTSLIFPLPLNLSPSIFSLIAFPKTPFFFSLSPSFQSIFNNFQDSEAHLDCQS